MAARGTTRNERHFRSGAPDAGPDSHGQVIKETTATIVEMEQREREPQSIGLQIAEAVSAISGSIAFVALNALWFATWVVWNSGIAGLPVFDPYPFTFLTFAVSLEAIFLSTFVLMTQNRQSQRADHRAIVDLQVNAIAERELTKILKIVADIHSHVGSGESHDPELDEMLETLQVKDLQEQAEQAEQGDGKRPAGLSEQQN